jgi:hypothetical protein
MNIQQMHHHHFNTISNHWQNQVATKHFSAVLTSGNFGDRVPVFKSLLILPSFD